MSYAKANIMKCKKILIGTLRSVDKSLSPTIHKFPFLRTRFSDKTRISLRVIKFLTLIPILQPIMHAYLGWKLYGLAKTEIRIQEDFAAKMYQLLTEYREKGKIGDSKGNARKLKDLAACMQETKEEQESLHALIQEIRLYEIAWESGPQAVLQIAIFFRIGFANDISAIPQFLSIVLSMISLASGSAESLLYAPTKKHPTKDECSWKQVWLMVVPLCLGIIVPRVITTGLLLAYLREFSFCYLPVFCLLCCSLSILGSFCSKFKITKSMLKDLLFGTLSNLFGPCVVVLQESSGFILTSTISGFMCHLLALVALSTAINYAPQQKIDQWLNTVRIPPLLHCFKNPNSNATERCLRECNGMNFKSSGCMEKWNPINCTEGWTNPLSLEGYERLGIATYCPYPQIPLAITCIILGVVHIGTVVLAKYLNYLIDPVGMLIASETVLGKIFKESRPPIWSDKFPKYGDAILAMMTMNERNLHSIVLSHGLDVPLSHTCIYKVSLGRLDVPHLPLFTPIDKCML